jgi:hypothetical protein
MMAVFAVLQSDFLISPSALPWWGWLLCAAIAALIAYVLWIASNGNWVAVIFSLILWIVASIAALIGIVRMIKWIWES